MTASRLDIRVQDIDHCGIVAGICDEMELVEQINRLLGSHPQEVISAGQVVKAMILNGLGFVSAHWCQVKKNRWLSRVGKSMVKVNQHPCVEKAMSKPRKKQGNPDFRHRVSVPAPASQEIESRLFELVSPGTFANLKGVKDKERSLRSRVLTLPVMAAIVLSIVYRQIQHLTDVLRSLEIEGFRVTRVLSQGSHYKDEIIHMGLNHTHPCHHPMRLVSVLWGK
ncbi:DUF4277 domain-containing protein, partial [Nostoc favosum]